MRYGLESDPAFKSRSLQSRFRMPKSYEFLPESIFEEMRLTQYMRNELKDIEHYCVAAGREDELLDLLKKMRREERLPVKDKKAGREVLDEIYSYLR